MFRLLWIVVFVISIPLSNSRCPNYCSGHGKCTRNDKCECFPGWGATSDITTYRAPDCSSRVCRTGLSWGDVIDTSGNAHYQILECSGVGSCIRSTGVCNCPPEYEGPACERRKCPNNCSGHGRCLSMKQIALLDYALPLSSGNVTYGTVSHNASDTWDSEKIYGCVCDSSWPVGLGRGQIQEPEWFGPDCSLRHCPSADDPRTRRNETDCYNVTAPNGGVGRTGNLCQIDCANRGVCDYRTGTCDCFENFFGPACTVVDVHAVGSVYNPDGSMIDVSTISGTHVVVSGYTVDLSDEEL